MQPASEQLLQSPGFGPPADSDDLGQIQVSTIHQLDVEGSTEGAMQLAAVFGKAASVAGTLYQQKAAADTAQGAADAAMNNVDPARLAMASNYADGVKRVAAQAAAVKAAQDATAFAKQHPDMPLTDSTDANGQVTPGLTTSVDNIFRNAFPPGSSQDPVVASLITPIVQRTMNELTGAARNREIQQSQQAAEDSQTALVTHDAANPGTAGLFDPKLALDTLTKIYGGDQRLGRDALVHAIGEGAVQSGNPGVIEKYLPSGMDFGNGATLTPDNLQYLQGAFNRATATQQRVNENQIKAAGMTVVQAISSNKDPAAALDSYMKLPGASPEFARSMIDWSRSQGADKASRVLDSTDAATLQADIMNGKVTTLEAAQQRVAALGYTSGSAVQLVTHAASWLNAKHQTDESDPQFQAARNALQDLYRPGIDPLTGQFSKPEDVVKRANVLTSFVANYQSNLTQPGTTAADAARKASDAAQKTWGPPSALDTTQHSKLPTNDYEAAAYIRNTANRTPQALSAAGITPARLKALRDSNLISADEADAAAKVWLTGRH